MIGIHSTDGPNKVTAHISKLIVLFLGEVNPAWLLANSKNEIGMQPLPFCQKGQTIKTDDPMTIMYTQSQIKYIIIKNNIGKQVESISSV